MPQRILNMNERKVGVAARDVVHALRVLNEELRMASAVQGCLTTEQRAEIACAFNQYLSEAYHAE